MGITKSSQKVPKINPTVIPKLSYLNRSQKFALLINGKKTEKFKLSEDLDLYTDSAIGEIQDCKLFIAGGSDNNGVLKSKAFIIDLNSMIVQILAPLPLPSKLGHILSYKNFVYYVSGISEDQFEPSKYISSPIMRYNLDDKN